MSKSRKGTKGKTGHKSPPTPKSRWLPVFVLVLLGAASLAYFLYFQEGRGPKDLAKPTRTESPAQGKDTPGLGPDARRLIGRWTRPDGGYIIEIRNIDASGRADAGYYNPRPIHVSQAILTRRDNGLELFMELRDEGYPGSTYTLVYDAQRDMLAGIYYQAAMNQSFDVIFLKAK